MEKQELDKIIARIEATNSIEEAYFGIFTTGDVNQEEGFIKGNREGLCLFATELLKAAGRAGSMVDNDGNVDSKRSTISPLDPNVEWMDELSAVRIAYIESSDEPREKAEFQPYIKSRRDKAFEAGCFLLFILAMTSMIIGIVTVVKWMF